MRGSELSNKLYNFNDKLSFLNGLLSKYFSQKKLHGMKYAVRNIKDYGALKIDRPTDSINILSVGYYNRNI